MIQVGDSVKVLFPFDVAFPEIYTVEFIHPDGTCVIATDRDFDPIYLERVAS